MAPQLAVGDLLYHSVHGICRINEVIRQKESDKEVIYYALKPKAWSALKQRYLISKDRLHESAFHKPITAKEAHQILDYLQKNSKKKSASSAMASQGGSFAADNQTWALAATVLACAHNAEEAKDQHKRQKLERSLRGLIHELAFALKISIAEAGHKVRDCLVGRSAKTLSTSVTSAIENVISEFP